MKIVSLENIILESIQELHYELWEKDDTLWDNASNELRRKWFKLIKKYGSSNKFNYWDNLTKSQLKQLYLDIIQFKKDNKV